MIPIYDIDDTSELKHSTLQQISDLFKALTRTITNHTVSVDDNSITQGTPSTGQYLRDNGTKFVGAALQVADLDTDPLARANHTGTQTSSTISDFPTTISQAEAETGTSTTDRLFTAQRTRQSAEASRKDVQLIPFDFTTDLATGDGKFYFHISDLLDGMNLVYVHAEVITAGTTGTTDIQIHNLTQTADMLSTKLTIDSGETGSDTAATPAVIDTANDDVAQNDLIRLDVDAVSTTAPKGLIVTLGFEKP